MTPDYGDLTEDACDERRSVDDWNDDDGGVIEMLTDDEMSTIEDVMTFGEDEAAELVRAPQVQAWPDYQFLLAGSEGCFPDIEV